MDYEIDKKNLKRCAEISRQSREAGNTPFGALLAGKDGSILLEQPNIEITEGKCTGHVISDKIPFLSQVPTAFPSVIVTIIWQGIPFFALMLLAALQGVSSEIYEASSIDGAAAWQKLFYITIPSIKNTIFVTALLRVIWVANSVDVIFNMAFSNIGNCPDIYHIQLWISDQFRKDCAGVWGNGAFNFLCRHILNKTCSDSESLQVREKIQSSAKQTASCYNFISCF